MAGKNQDNKTQDQTVNQGRQTPAKYVGNKSDADLDAERRDQEGTIPTLSAAVDDGHDLSKPGSKEDARKFH